jgi:NADH-ubiquinone oxidoreductase chain 5
MNRIGDWGFSLGLFSIFLIFGNLDLTTIVTLAPVVDANLLNIISLFLLLGAMAKSAQIGLHVWLPNAMEGSGKNI